MSVLEQMPVAANEDERSALSRIQRLLKSDSLVPKLVSSEGEEIPLPRSLVLILRQITYHLIRNRPILVTPITHEMVSTQDAADILNISRPYLIGLLDRGEIPFVKVGSHRRIRFSDLMDYKKKRDAERQRSLDEIAQMSHEAGLDD